VKTCGLPSHFAHFGEDKGGAEGGAGAGGALSREREPAHGWWKNSRRPKGKFFGLFDKKEAKKSGGGGRGKKGGKGKHAGESLALRDEAGGEVCTLALPPAAPSMVGPRIKIALPSFSGRTADCPHLLKYSLDLRANVRLSDAIRVNLEEEEEEEEKEGERKENGGGLWEPQGVRRFPPQMAMAAVTLSATPSPAPAAAAATPIAPAAPSPPPPREMSGMREALAAIIGGKPLLCLAFDRMEMDVGSPVRVG
jgi:hypothetical protein